MDDREPWAWWISGNLLGFKTLKDSSNPSALQPLTLYPNRPSNSRTNFTSNTIRISVILVIPCRPSLLLLIKFKLIRPKMESILPNLPNSIKVNKKYLVNKLDKVQKIQIRLRFCRVGAEKSTTECDRKSWRQMLGLTPEERFYQLPVYFALLKTAT